MENTAMCQMCAKTQRPGRLGTNADKSPQPLYCDKCFQDGKFASGREKWSLEEMQAHVHKMVSETPNMTDADATKAAGMVPNLIFWRYKATVK